MKVDTEQTYGDYYEDTEDDLTSFARLYICYRIAIHFFFQIYCTKNHRAIKCHTCYVIDIFDWYLVFVKKYRFSIQKLKLIWLVNWLKTHDNKFSFVAYYKKNFVMGKMK